VADSLSNLAVDLRELEEHGQARELEEQALAMRQRLAVALAWLARYREHLRRQGHEVGRLRVVPAGESAPLYSDLWDVTGRELVEAKGLVTREQLRSAVDNCWTMAASSRPRPGRFSSHETAAGRTGVSRLRRRQRGAPRR
jgi:hypothetical protein